MRAIAYAGPVIVAYVVIRSVASMLFRPDGWLGMLVWIAQAAVIGAVVSRLVARVTRRLLPLATLFTTTLVFPDRAPSRFGIALRAGTVKQMKKRAAELRRNGLGTTEAEAAENAIVLVVGLGRHDRLTRGHTERVRAYADLIGDEMGLSAAERNMLAWGVLLHDIGKMTVPPEVLNKVERLTDDEWAVLKHHPAAGAEMLLPLAGWLGEWVNAAGEHHERWDGGGYPLGLTGAEISRAGRITAVADAYDVITSKRSYKEPMSAEAARRELVACAGSQFDPAVVRSFLSVSLGHRQDLGPFAWLTEVPILRAAGAAVGSPLAASIGGLAVATTALLGLGDDSGARRSAFAAELHADVPEISIPGLSDVGGRSIEVPRTGRPTIDRPPAVPAVPGTGAVGVGVDRPSDPTLVDGTPKTITDPSQPPSTTVPSTTVPSTTVPSVTVPSVTVPSVTVPSVTVPSVTVPSTTVPSVTVPSTTIPSVTVPSVTVPSVTVPSVTVPSATIPSVTVASVMVPPINTPLTTTPAITTPPITTPPITTPPIVTAQIQVPSLPSFPL